jgi:hypothetical protein
MSTTTAASGKNGHADFPAANLDDERWRRGLLAQQPEHRPGEVALERTERFQAALAVRLFALQVGTGAGVAAALNDRDLVQRTVELSVAVAVEPVAALLTGGRVDRRDTRQPRKLGVVAKPSGAAGLADDLAGNQRTAALELKQLRRIAGDAERDLALQIVRVARERAAAPHQVSRDPHTDGLFIRARRRATRSSQTARSSAPAGIRTLGRCRAAASATVLRFASLSHQRLAVIDQQLQIAGRVVLHSCRQLWVGEDGTRDREGVDAVGLAVGTRALAGPGHQLGRYTYDPFTVLEQEALKSAADAADVFERPHALTIDRQRPRKQLRIPRRTRRGGQLVDELAAAASHGDAGEGAIS